MINLKSKIREVPDWPKKGINFKDITPLLQDAKVFRYVINTMAKAYAKNKPDIVVGIDARGFIFASVLAYKLGAGLAIVRKSGKLPYKTIEKKYSLEYASNTLGIHKDAILKGQKVLIVDDVLATGGTVKATIGLVEKLEGRIIVIMFLAELTELKGRRKLKGYPVNSLVKY